MTTGTDNDEDGTMLTGVALSIIVPVLNGVDTIGETLDALAEQETQACWEVVVADNGSTDRTRDFVRARVRDFPAPLRLVDASEVSGAAFARNAGVLAASGSAIAFCDADDRVGASWIDSILESLVMADAVGGPLRELRSPFDPLAPLLRYSVERSRASGLMLMVGTGNFALHREQFVAVGGLDFSMTDYGGEDNELSVRLRKAQVSPVVNEAMVLYFRQTRSPRRALGKVYDSARAEVGIWRRHPDLFPDENRPQWSRFALLRLPKELLDTLRTRDPRKFARVLVRRAGNLRAQAQLPREPVSVAGIGTMTAPRDITVGE